MGRIGKPMRPIFCIRGCNLIQNKLQYGYNFSSEGVVTLKRKVLGGILCAVMLLGIGTPAYAEETPPVVEVTVDGELVEVEAFLYGGTSYFPLDETVRLFYPQAEIQRERGICTILDESLTMTAQVGGAYLVINGRYLYSAEGLKERDKDGMVMVPARLLGKALGLGVDWSGKVEFTTGGEPLSAEDVPYTEDELDLIARVITHESGNQSLQGKMAVGNVILNRVADKRFPATVSEVIYQKNQFPGATSMEPNAESILAAKLVLEGANVVPGAFYFNGVGKSCWASRNKTLLYTIGGHAFYG